MVLGRVPAFGGGGDMFIIRYYKYRISSERRETEARVRVSV